MTHSVCVTMAGEDDGDESRSCNGFHICSLARSANALLVVIFGMLLSFARLLPKNSLCKLNFRANDGQGTTIYSAFSTRSRPRRLRDNSTSMEEARSDNQLTIGIIDTLYKLAGVLCSALALARIARIYYAPSLDCQAPELCRLLTAYHQRQRPTLPS